MGKYFYVIIFVSLFIEVESHSQSGSYVIKPASFSSKVNDEFSPVFYKEGIVFCSDESDNSLVRYGDDQKRLFKIFYVTRGGRSGWTHPKIFAKEITTTFNDGPVTFNENENIIYYSRNNSIENSMRNISDTSNNLGIYSAELSDGMWTDIRPFTYNNPLYSFCTPALTPEGERIYFSSDMPGGFGRMDLYYCNRSNKGWDQPVNLGPIINTPGNESFPFACAYGKLYFASDGHKGNGGKDLFYTQEINGEWIAPVHLDSEINSSADDFGLVIDSTFENGYFSTNRLKSDDIFSFSSPPVAFTSCDSIIENRYCYTFYDEHQQLIDTVPAIYQWDFGSGIIRIGKEVQHCFPGPGKYSVKLTITDQLTGDTISNQVDYKVDIENVLQADIKSFNVGIVDKPVSFEGLVNNLNGLVITDYYWDLEDGFKPGGPLISKTFKKKGDYIIKLGLLAEKDSLGIIPKVCIMKKIRIYNSYQEFALRGGSARAEVNEKTDSVSNNNKELQITIYLMDDLSGQQKTKIEEAFIKYGQLLVRFDQFGIKPDSYQLLDNIAGVLKENRDINLGMIVHSVKDEIPGNKMTMPEIWAQELSLYFRNKDLNRDCINSKGFGLSNQFSGPFVPEGKTIDGIIEFIFAKNK